MQTIRLVLDEPLLQATDQAAHEAKVDRSVLMRRALRTYLQTLQVRDKEKQDRDGYELRPDTTEDLEVWEQVAAWPDP